jgi:hypothetical protein
VSRIVGKNFTQSLTKTILTKRQSILNQSLCKPSIEDPPHYDCNVSELSFDDNEQNIDSKWTLELRNQNRKFQFGSIESDDNLSNDDLGSDDNNSLIMDATIEHENVLDRMYNFHDSILSNPGSENEQNVVDDIGLANEIISVVDNPRLLVPPALTSYANLYKVMNKLHVPFYGYDLILNTIRKEMFERNLDFRKNEYSRKSFMKEIKQFSLPKT